MSGAPIPALPPVSGMTTPTVHQETPTVTQKDTTFTKIFVGGLPYNTNDQSLRKHFEEYGDIEEAVVITDRQTGKSRGYGFVSMILIIILDLHRPSLTHHIGPIIVNHLRWNYLNIGS